MDGGLFMSVAFAAVIFRMFTARLGKFVELNTSSPVDLF